MRDLLGYLWMIGLNQALLGNGGRLSLYLVNEVRILIANSCWVSDTHYVYHPGTLLITLPNRHFLDCQVSIRVHNWFDMLYNCILYSGGSGKVGWRQKLEQEQRIHEWKCLMRQGHVTADSVLGQLHNINSLQLDCLFTYRVDGRTTRFDATAIRKRSAVIE